MSYIAGRLRGITMSWARKHEEFNSRIVEVGGSASLSISDKKGIAMLAHAGFPASEVEFEASPFLMLNLCTGHVGKMRRAGDGLLLEGVLRPGTFALALPETKASGYVSKTDMLGVLVNLDLFNAFTDNVYTANDFVPAATQLHNDAFLSAVMTALWRDAETHGLSSAFFEQGISVILKHLNNMESKPQDRNVSYPLRGERLQKVLDFIESKMGDDISVSELADLVGQDVRSFTQSFSTATGYPPYAYFTLRRIEYAKRLLCQAELTITDVAMVVGYSNPSKFSAAFRRIVGVTPNTWRKDVNMKSYSN